MKHNNQAFTLIELLVVVLIIAILAAIALPQYRLAVVKARFNTYLPLISTISAAEEEYYMIHGTYTINPTLLDITLPKQCTTFGGFYNEWKCGNDIFLDFGRTGTSSKGAVSINYCPKYNQSYAACHSKRAFAIAYHWNHHPTSPGKKTCTAYNSSKLGQQFCNNLKWN